LLRQGGFAGSFNRRKSYSVSINSWHFFCDRVLGCQPCLQASKALRRYTEFKEWVMILNNFFFFLSLTS
jgi:hypothetical protein